MAFPNAPTEGGGAKLHFLTTDANVPAGWQAVVTGSTGTGANVVGAALVATHVQGGTLTAPGGTTMGAGPVVCVAGRDGTAVRAIQVDANGLVGVQTHAVTVSGTVTVDTLNLPATSALSDTLGNPTTTQIGANQLLWTGSVWVRAPGSIAGGALVTVGAASGITQLPTSLGAKTIANALAVSIASDQTVPVSGAVTVSGAVSITGTVDTELASVLSADGMANGSIPQVQAWNMGYNGTTWDRLRSDITNGLDVDVTRVPADPFGANADAVVAAGATGSISAKLRRATQGLEDLKTGIILAAGSAAIGKLAANSGVDIGDVDVTSVTPGTTATALGKAIDASQGAADVGVAALVVRDDVLTTLTPADGDYVPLRVNSTGALHVTGGGGGTQYNVDDPLGSTPTGTVLLAIRDDALSALAPAEGDAVGLRVNSTGALHVTGGGGGTEFNAGDALGATPAGKVALGAFNTTQPTLTSGQANYPQLSVRGALLVAPGTEGFPVSGAVTVSGNLTTITTVTTVASVTAIANALPAGTNRLGSVRIVDASDTAFATAGNPLRTDPTGTTTQPVSGSVTVSGSLTTVSTVTAVTAITNALPAGANRIGKVTVRNSADSADIDPLAESTFTARIPTIGQKTMAGSLSVVVASDQSAIAVTGTLTAVTTVGTVTAVTAITNALPAGANRIGKITIRNAADAADIDPLAESTFTTRIPTVGQKAMAASVPVVIASDQSAVPISGTVTVTGSLTGVTTVSTVTAVTSITNAVMTVGNVAHIAADSGAPVKIGGKVTTTTPTSVTVGTFPAAGDRTDAWFDDMGRLVTVNGVVKPNGPVAVTFAVGDGISNKALVAAPGANLAIYVTGVVVTNDSASLTTIALKDGTTTKGQAALAASGGGFTFQFQPAWQLTSATALNGAVSVAVNNVYVTVHYYIGRAQT